MKGIDKLRVWRAGRTISNFGIYVIWCNNISWIWNTVTEKATASYHWGLNYPSAKTNVTHDFKKARIDVFILYIHVSFLAVTCSRSKPPFVASAVLSLQDVFLFASQTSSFSDQSGPLSVSSHINSLRTHHTQPIAVTTATAQTAGGNTASPLGLKPKHGEHPSPERHRKPH